MLEAASLAPKLRHCAFEPDVGLWVIVMAMDYITEEVAGEADEPRARRIAPDGDCDGAQTRVRVWGPAEAKFVRHVRQGCALRL